MTASRPPASMNCAAASTFGPMLPGGNWPSARWPRASATVICSIGRSSRRAEVERHAVDAGQQQQRGRAHQPPDQRRREVLVDDRVHADQLARRRARPARPRRRRPPRSRRRRAGAGSGATRRPRPAPARRPRAASRARRPRPRPSRARSPAAAPGPRRRRGRSAWWASAKAGSSSRTTTWVITAATVRGRPAEASASPIACDEQVAELALGHRAEHEQRLHRHLAGDGLLGHGERADLGAVAVHHQQAAVGVEQGDRRVGHVARALLLAGEVAEAGGGEGVAADRQHHRLAHPPHLLIAARLAPRAVLASCDRDPGG